MPARQDDLRAERRRHAVRAAGMRTVAYLSLNMPLELSIVM
jgi:hypothetical protein